MIKIAALNEELEEESGSEEEVTREALEQIALQQYIKALDLQRKGNLSDATQLLKDLLDTELLYDIKNPEKGEKVSGPLLNLKYLCHKNLGSMLNNSGDLQGAIESYCAASELDDTDVTLWYRLGQLSMQAKRYELALYAFQRGTDCNPHHWPCIDKTITILLGLDHKEECISTIYEALKLDPDYLRGLVYRRHIFTTFKHMKEYMEYLNPIYKWNENDEEPFDEQKADDLLKEADCIREIFIEQQKAEQLKNVLPLLKLNKPITNLTWYSVGESLTHMHKYMADNYYSHACHLELIYEKDDKVEAMDICEDPKKTDSVENKFEENNTDGEKNAENSSDNENTDLSEKEKATTDNEKVESDIEGINLEMAVDALPEPKVKKQPVLRRSSALSSLEQWSWCTKRKSVRKKQTSKDRLDNNIYDTLRRFIPLCLSPNNIDTNENLEGPTPLTVDGLEKFFEHNPEEENFSKDIGYFGTEKEQTDVEKFITKYREAKYDIIDMLHVYLLILSHKWKVKWPEELAKVFVKANKCYNNHIDAPSFSEADQTKIVQYSTINLLVEEISVNDKFISNMDENEQYDISVVESIGFMLTQNPQIFEGTVCLEYILRYLWLKFHIYTLNKCHEAAIDCLYQLLCEFEAMGEHKDNFSIKVVNFTFKPFINISEIMEYIKFLERNNKLSTVLDLYKKSQYEDVLSIVIDSFEHCKDMARKQEEEMSLDFAVQLSLILDSYWALDNVDECFKWSLICLHEALKHYFRYTSGSREYEKWTLTVVKILCTIEHILTTDGLSCLEKISQKDLSQGLEDLIRIIGHQVETTATEMPFDTVVPWIILHYILQREEDSGRGKASDEKDRDTSEDVPNSLMVLFIGHERLGNRGWCCKNEARLLYFIIDTVVPRLRSPALSKPLEQICQYMEQCVYCLYGYPARKNKVKYLAEHNVTPYPLKDWDRAQQVYEIFRPSELPELEGKVSGITSDIETLFLRILELVPSDCSPTKFIPDIKKYIEGLANTIPEIPSLLPYKIKDIYFLLGDYHFKREEGKLSVKYNLLDVAVTNDRLESWAEISLAKSVNLIRLLNSCKNLNNERDFLNPAKSIIRCFKRALEIDPTHCNLWIEYGIFVYMVHSFCSRLLEQSSDSLSMEDFTSLEKQKEDMLDTTEKCFTTVLEDLDTSNVSEKDNEDSWLPFYMLGKVAEKRKKSPSIYLDYYIKAVKSLQESSATYPLKINYSSPSHLCIQVLELHYRIHASILKYIEQHEGKPITVSLGKVFMNSIEEWKEGPLVKKPRTEGTENNEIVNEPVQAANILKRSISDAGEEGNSEAKKVKLETAAAKVRRSASNDTEMRVATSFEETKSLGIGTVLPDPPSSEPGKKNMVDETAIKKQEEKVIVENKKTLVRHEECRIDKREDSSSSTSSSSSSSSSSGSSSDSSSESSRESGISNKSVNENKLLSEDDLNKIISACLVALEDCASRFPLHYKAIYRLAHYHFYSAKGRNIERCRDLMLSTFTSKSGQKLGGLFNDRKPSNFFNNIWKIPVDEIDRAGSFAYHMNRSVLLTMQILKEIDDHKTLLELSLQLQRIPDPDKKYVRDADREDLSQQAYTLCVKSLRGQLLKFSQQADLNSNDVERQALNSLLVDIYRAYQKAQKQLTNSKLLSNLLVDGYKLVKAVPITENLNLVDISIKYCQSLVLSLKQQATQASLEKSQNSQKKQIKLVDNIKATPAPLNQPKSAADKVTPMTAMPTSSSLPKVSTNDIASSFQNYIPNMLNDPILSQQAAAALSLSYLSNLSALAGYSSLQNNFQSSLQSSLQNSFQAEFYRQFLNQTMTSFLPPPKKQKRGPKPGSTRLPAPSSSATVKSTKSSASTNATITKATPTPVITSLHKSIGSNLAPSMGTVLPTLPASMTATLAPYSASQPSQTSHSMSLSHPSSSSNVTSKVHTKPSLPLQQVSPSKTLQEKLAERQKHLPKPSAHDINTSIGRLPSSLTITKTNLSKPPAAAPTKKPEAKKSLPFNDSDVIILDDD